MYGEVASERLRSGRGTYCFTRRSTNPASLQYASRVSSAYRARFSVKDPRRSAALAFAASVLLGLKL